MVERYSFPITRALVVDESECKNGTVIVMIAVPKHCQMIRLVLLANHAFRKALHFFWGDAFIFLNPFNLTARIVFPARVKNLSDKIFKIIT